MLRTLCTVGLLVAGLTLTTHASAEANTNTNGSTYAIEGYDPVAYFTDHKAVKGSPEHAFTYQRARWLFASEEHRRAFADKPAAYAPQYAGYCSYAVSRGRLVKIDPRAFTVRNGKLYLNYSLEIRETWLDGVDARIQKADELFPKLTR
jgi:YHS domain-containing protein